VSLASCLAKRFTFKADQTKQVLRCASDEHFEERIADLIDLMCGPLLVGMRSPAPSFAFPGKPLLARDAIGMLVLEFDRYR
jgi:hypothetical protein